ncbi:WhiB family transcriptional regulator [Streptomyces antimicrobicus]|uniref:WhiB family transcriptional regulator n=1 Tax=Streptomyces antimicrobicus TaxID=2883108 RepID=A0ABS8BEC1_9ACTN|nr:WhiB family transcriptional regulator [Streptomyces antimicrobicus]MCB5182873.1 WhiB family transcriptional regulator [Streptomyces antimicrobicus]
MGTAALRHTARPGTDELVVRYRLMTRSLRPAPEGAVAVCATTDPEAFFPEAAASGLAQNPNRAERIALAMCDGCPLMDRCLVGEMRGVPSVFQVRGIRAGLRQSERRALYLALEKTGEL